MSVMPAANSEDLREVYRAIRERLGNDVTIEATVMFRTER